MERAAELDLYLQINGNRATFERRKSLSIIDLTFASSDIAQSISTWKVQSLCDHMRLKNKGTPGPDGLPPEAVKLLVNTSPELVLNVLNENILTGMFPSRWKQAKLVLIKKRTSQ